MTLEGVAGRRSFDPFRVLSEDARRRHLEGYRRHLEAHDGACDLERRTLARREAYFEELAAKPVAWEGGHDVDGFLAHFLGSGSPPIDARTAWMVAAAKANEGESYGVDLELRRLRADGPPATALDEIYAYLLLEEGYHGRILVEVCRTLGLDVRLQAPRWGQRLVIHLIQRLPDRLRWILVICGEVLGSTVFALLRDRCDLFSAQPEVEARLRSLLHAICADEVFHVAFLRARMGGLALRVARALLPVVARSLMWGIPGRKELGFEPAELLRRMRSGLEIPPEGAWMEADPPRVA